MKKAATLPRSQEKTVAPPDLTWLAYDPSYSDVSDTPNVHTDLRYGSENNFLGKNLYGDFDRCYLHRVAAEKFRRAARALEKTRPVEWWHYDALPKDAVRKNFKIVE
jgi:D-alanyl-D-alanine dipeptidase